MQEKVVFDRLLQPPIHVPGHQMNDDLAVHGGLKIDPCCSKWRRRAMELTRLPLWATLSGNPLWVAMNGWVLMMFDSPVVE